jgi:RNA-directed DNA polymerase
LDYSDFFSSIGSRPIYRVFESAGYPELLAFEMAMLCTYGTTIALNSEVNGTRPYKHVSRRFLAQGAPTSGALSNLALRTLDKDLSELELAGFTLTRYADDITISSARSLTQKEVGAVIGNVAELSSTYRLTLNRSKTQVLRNKDSFRILGLAVTSSGVGLTRPYKRRFETEIFGIKKVGLSNQSIYKGYTSPMDYVAFLWGHVAFAKGIDPIWSQRMSDRLESMGVPFIDAIGVFGSSIP